MVMGLMNIKINEDISCIQETGVANFMRCNIWHVKGRDYDLVIDTGMGLNPLKEWIMKETDRPIKAIGTHSHFDHSGSMHEFSCRLGHKLESKAFASGGRSETMYRGGWTKIEIVNPKEHPNFSTQTFSVKPAPLTGYLDEGDILDLGDKAFQILHLPGHSPGSIGLFDVKKKILFSGDAIYNGELLDTHPHSDKQVYRKTLERLQSLDAEIIHAGHEPSFGKSQMQKIITDYLSGYNAMSDPVTWFNSVTKSGVDHYSDQRW
jgi:glyoxylase-like metal-dependent hydrolase (beta-lactamase superfamily II)